MAATGHDLMQPLQVVTHALTRLRGAALDERDIFWLDAAMAQTKRINGGLSDLVRASTQEQRFLRQPVNLGDVLGEVQRAWSVSAMLAGVTLKVVIRDVFAVTDRERLLSIIGNLVCNAIKYSPGGRVVVGCRLRAGQVAVDVVDNGKGIAEPDQDRVFAAFCQLNPTAPGFGLGLSIVRDHCLALDHDLQLVSNLGRGSRFRVVLGQTL
jgi:signal transduction histidine kinase